MSAIGVSVPLFLCLEALMARPPSLRFEFHFSSRERSTSSMSTIYAGVFSFLFYLISFCMYFFVGVAFGLSFRYLRYFFLSLSLAPV